MYQCICDGPISANSICQLMYWSSCSYKLPFKNKKLKCCKKYFADIKKINNQEHESVIDAAASSCNFGWSQKNNRNLTLHVKTQHCNQDHKVAIGNTN